MLIMLPKRHSIRKLLAGAVSIISIVVLGSYATWHWLTPRTPTPLLLRQALAAIEAKNGPAAALLLDTILDREPVNGKALLYRGQVARDLGDEQAAASFWSRVPDSLPQEAGTARFLEATLALASHQARQAERLLLRSTQLHPAYLYPRERLVYLYLLQLRDTDLRRELAAIRAVRHWTLSELTESLGTMGRIFPIAARTSELEKFVAADGNDIWSTLALAECFLADEQPDKARELLEKSLAQHPGDLRLRGRLIEMYVKLNQLERAGEILRDEALPSDAPVEMLRAQGAYRAAIGDWESAVLCLERACLLDGSHLPTLYSLGQALERVGRHDEGVQILKRNRLLEQIVLQSWRLASTESKRTEFLASIVIEIARLLIELERFSDAAVWFEQAIAWYPDDPRFQEQQAVAIQRAEAAELKKSPTGLEETQWTGTGRVVTSHEPSTLPLLRRSGTGLKGTKVEKIPELNLVDRHSQAGIEFEYYNGAGGSKFLLETLGGGVAAFDFDADGWPDLYFTQGRPLPVILDGKDQKRDRIFQNLGGTFRDVTEAAGLGDTQYSQGCSAADFDNDGFVDLAIANFGTNVLYHNNGDGTFSDVTHFSGITGEHWSSSLAWADFDRDGNLDLYVVTYVLDPYRVCRAANDQIATCSPLNFQAEPDQLFRNRGDGTFDDVTIAAGIVAEDGKGLGIVVADFDDDGWPDIYVANDGTPNFLYHNETAIAGGPLKFVERGLASGAAVNAAGISQAGMGVACGDLDGDGQLDLFVTNFYRESATFYQNQGNLLFVDATRAARLDDSTRPFLGFGTQALDVDLDGRLDLFIANGHIDDFSFRGEPWKMHPQLFYNVGGARFADASPQAGEYFQGEYLGRGVARLDWDRDGRPEVVVVHQDRPAALLHNETPTAGNRLILDLHGIVSNRDAIGARVIVSSGGMTLVHEISGGDGFFATNERRVILGLGRFTAADRLEVHWPSGRTDKWTDLKAEMPILLIESQPPKILRQQVVPWGTPSS